MAGEAGEFRGRGLCVVCHRSFDVRDSREEELFVSIDFQGHFLGPESLTEHEQMVFDLRCCSYECYERLP